MTKWQPIATAPRGGTIILGWNEKDGIAIIEFRPHSSVYNKDSVINQWSVVHDAEDYYWSDYTPTHWMPLPNPPPTTSQERSEK